METYLQNFRSNIDERNQYEKGSDEWALNNSQAMSAVLGGGLTLANGAVSLLDNARQLSSLHDVNKYDYQLNQLTQARDGKTWDMNQLIEQQQSLPTFQAKATDFGPSNSDIRKGVLSSAMSGAAAGGKTFGLLGAIGGGLIGGATALFSGKSGQAEAERFADAQNTLQKIQKDRNGVYYRDQADKINDFAYGNLWSNRADDGGEIERRQRNLQDFANAVLKKQTARPDRSSGIIRRHCNGGTMIRIKR